MAPTPITTPQGSSLIDADAVARAEKERADKLAKELEETKKQLSAAKRDPKSASAQLADALATIEEMKRDQAQQQAEFRGAMEAGAALAAKMVTGPKPLAPEHKGTKKYRLRQPHYRNGTWYSAGDVITVTDERPSKTWVEVKSVPASSLVEVEAPSPAAEKPPRASDQQV